jgi:hypothetical protein
MVFGIFAHPSLRASAVALLVTPSAWNLEGQ